MNIISRYLIRHHHQYIRRQDISQFFQQLLTLINAGITLTDCLHLTQQTQRNPSLNQLIEKIKYDLLTGKTFFACLQPYSQHFPPLTLQLIYLGEQSGKLEKMLALCIESIENQLILQEKIKKILLYPCCLLISATCLSLCLFIFIIPRFADLLQNLPGEIPLFTRTIFTIAKLLQPGKWFLLIIISILVIMNLYPSNRQRFLAQFHKICSRLPLINYIMQLQLLTQFCQQLLCTISAGVPLTDGLHLMTQISSPSTFLPILLQLQYKMRQGWPLHHALAMHTLFPDMMIQMIRIGEESGKIDIMLQKIIILYQTEMDRLLHRVTSLLEPLIMLILGVLIGGLVIAMYLPIFNLGSLF